MERLSTNPALINQARRKTPEEYGAQVSRIVDRLFKRAKVIPYEHRVDGINSITVHTSNVYGSTGRAADNLRAGNLAYSVQNNQKLVDITRWRERNETHKNANSRRTDYLQDEPGPATGAIQIVHHSPDGPNIGRYNFIDVTHSQSWDSEPQQQVLRAQEGYSGSLKESIQNTALALALARQVVHEAEMRQQIAEQ